MRHQWVIDVLLDLQSYAMVNELPQLAARIEETLAQARKEILCKSGDPVPDGGLDGEGDGGSDGGDDQLSDLTSWHRRRTH